MFFIAERHESTEKIEINGFKMLLKRDSHIRENGKQKKPWSGKENRTEECVPVFSLECKTVDISRAFRHREKIQIKYVCHNCCLYSLRKGLNEFIPTYEDDIKD